VKRRDRVRPFAKAAVLSDRFSTYGTPPTSAIARGDTCILRLYLFRIAIWIICLPRWRAERNLICPQHCEIAAHFNEGQRQAAVASRVDAAPCIHNFMKGIRP
jgi:hypothetical protein